MNYQEFLTTIRTQLSLRIETGVTLDIRSFTKNNGTHYDGLVLLHPKKNVSPAIYLMPYYHRYLEGDALKKSVKIFFIPIRRMPRKKILTRPTLPIFPVPASTSSCVL